MRFVVSGQILQVLRGPNGTQYIIQQPQQPILLQQQMQPGGVQAPVIQQVCPHTVNLVVKSFGINKNFLSRVTFTRRTSNPENQKPTLSNIKCFPAVLGSFEAFP